MSRNPTSDNLKNFETTHDILDITDIVSEYERSSGIYLDIDRARKKIVTLRENDPIINAMCAPKPHEPIIPLNETTQTQLYNILISIRAYLETKLIHDAQSQQGGTY